MPLRAQTESLPDPYRNTSGISFPVAAMGNAHPPMYEPQYNYFSPQDTAAADKLPDPYLSARYQQPLPLPLSSSPPGQPTARRDPASEAAEIRRQALLHEEHQQVKRKEQEEADAALARQLDLELNLGDTGHDGHMPGGW
jgi:hypothetical protein